MAVPWLRPVFDPGSVLMNFVVNKEALGQVLFSKSFGFFLPSIIPSMHYSQFIFKLRTKPGDFQLKR